MKNKNSMLDNLKDLLSTPKQIKEAKEWFAARIAEEPIIPKGWVSIEDHLPMWMAEDFMQGGTGYRIKFANGYEGTSMVSDHNVWYYEAKEADITHWWNE